MTPHVKIAPSLLAADFGCLEAEAKRAQAAKSDCLHLDIMDGHFAPNFSMGPDVVKMAKRAIDTPLSVHLMLTRPDRYAERFINAGADILLIHVEAECEPLPLLREIRRLGAAPGITLNPETPADAAWPLLDEVDEVLCMTVHPGFGGQRFIDDVLEKIRAVRAEAVRRGRPLDISVDGGVTHETGVKAASAGANLLIAGTFLFAADDMGAAVADLRRDAEAAFSQVHA